MWWDLGGSASWSWLMAIPNGKLARDKPTSFLGEMFLSMVGRFNVQNHCFSHGGAIFTGLVQFTLSYAVKMRIALLDEQLPCDENKIAWLQISQGSLLIHAPFVMSRRHILCLESPVYHWKNIAQKTVLQRPRYSWEKRWKGGREKTSSMPWTSSSSGAADSKLLVQSTGWLHHSALVVARHYYGTECLLNIFRGLSPQ